MNKSEIYKLGYGFALGNSLDVNTTNGAKKKGISWETGWGNNPIDKQTIQNIKSRGFKTIKIPISWIDHLKWDDENNKFICDKWWITRCKEVVQLVLDEGMYCIINTQHDADWIKEIENIIEPNVVNLVVNKFRSLWNIIATEFKDFNSDLLLYESMNEVGFHKNFSDGSFIKLCNAFTEEVRKADENDNRLLLISGPYNDTVETLNNFPADKITDTNYAISIHFYTPALFTIVDNIGNKVSRITVEMEKSLSSSDKSEETALASNSSDIEEGYIDKYGGEVLVERFSDQEVQDTLNKLKEIEEKYNTKVIIAEFGCNPFCRDKDDVYDWFKMVTKTCQENKIPLVLWNSGNQFQCILRDENMQDRKSIDMEKIIRYYNNVVFDEELPESFRSDSDDFTKQIDEDQSLI